MTRGNRRVRWQPRRGKRHVSHAASAGGGGGGEATCAQWRRRTRAANRSLLARRGRPRASAAPRRA
eukprot:5719049-Alexandrium_andersonii.AAC.1